MDIYLDTVDVNYVREVYGFGLIDGITTNPALVAKTDRDYREIITEYSEFVNGPVCVQVTSDDVEGIVEQAREYNTWGEDIIVKIPATKAGFHALRELNDLGIRSMVTTLFSPKQALIAAKLNADFIAPWASTVSKFGYDGIQVVSDIVQIYDRYGFRTGVIVAGIRDPHDITEIAKIGVSGATIEPDIFDELFSDPAVDWALSMFEQAWNENRSSQINLG